LFLVSECAILKRAFIAQTAAFRSCVRLLAGLLFCSAWVYGAQQVRMPAGRAGIVDLEAKQQRRQGDLYIAEGDVDIRYRDLRLRADYAEYNSATQDALARGHVQFDYDNQHLEADEARVNVHSGRGTFANVRATVKIARAPNTSVLVTSNPLYFEAQQVERLDERTYDIRHVWMTVCLPDHPKWKFYAPHARLKLNHSVALINANFRLFRVPLVYLPYATAPAGRDMRQSGLLLPVISSSTSKGFVFGDAFYWAPSSWFDTSLGAEFLSRRGWSQRAEVRARPWENISFSYNYFGVIDRGLPGPDGSLVSQGGHQQQLEFQALLPHGWRAVADVNELSSLTFRLAFTDTFGEAVNAEEHSAVFLTNHFGGFNLSFASLNDRSFLTIQPETSILLRSAPEARFSSIEQAPWKRLPIYFGFSAYAGAVHRADENMETAAAVQRSEIAPLVTVPLHWGPWLGVTTTAAFRSTRYGAEMLNGEVVNEAVSRNTGEITVDLRPPALERLFAKKGSGAKWKHVIEPELTYRYVTGVENFSRFIRFDENDTLTNTNEVEYGVTQRLYRKTAVGLSEEFLSWTVAQKHYFDPTFGGAIVPGERNVFQALNSITPFAFADGPRNWSPVVSDLKFTPGGRYDAEFLLDYDTQKNKLTTIGSLIKVRAYREFSATLAHYRIASDPTLQPLSNQIRALIGYGQLNRKGFNASAGFSYDITNQFLQNQIAQVSYNGGCCGIALEYRRLNLVPIRTENQFRIALTIANLGTFGNIRREEKIF
jgi:LPS-assembly protein